MVILLIARQLRVREGTGNGVRECDTLINVHVLKSFVNFTFRNYNFDVDEESIYRADSAADHIGGNVSETICHQ